MEEAQVLSAPKPCLEFSTKVQMNDDIFNILLTQKSENLLFKITQNNSIPPALYEAEFSKKDLDNASRYFRMFDTISDLFPELQNKIEENEYNIKKGERALLIYFNLNIKNIPDFFLTIKKIEASINSTVDSLCQLVNKLISDNKNMQKEIKELKNEIINLKNDVKELKQEKEEGEKKEKKKQKGEKKEKEKKEMEKNDAKPDFADIFGQQKNEKNIN